MSTTRINTSSNGQHVEPAVGSHEWFLLVKRNVKTRVPVIDRDNQGGVFEGKMTVKGALSEYSDSALAVTAGLNKTLVTKGKFYTATGSVRAHSYDMTGIDALKLLGMSDVQNTSAQNLTDALANETAESLN